MLLALRSQVELVAQGGYPAPLPSIGLLLGAASPDVTVALTGTASSGQAGTLTPAFTLTLSGSAASGQTGTLLEGDAQPLTGLAATSQTGSLTPSLQVALTGASATGQAGALAPATTLALTGLEATSATGTLTASVTSDVTVALTGLEAIALTGTLLPSGADAPVTGQTPAGASRTRRRLFVHIDGEDFEVESAQHAQALLDQAKALARRVAPQVAEERLRVHLDTRPRERPKVDKPIIVTSNPALHEVVNTARQAIFTIYKDAYRDAEIRLRMEARLRDDEADDEDLMMLL